MALERVDPLILEDLYAVDHLLRYALCAPFAKGKRVLDAACGVGFGSVMLKQQEASAVVGVDLGEDAIAICRQRWSLDGLRFETGNLQTLDSLQLGRFDLVTSFETLEHVEDPDVVLSQFRRHLNAGGILLGSVPGERDREEKNPFHLHHFESSGLMELLRRHFPKVELYRQGFAIQSSIRRQSTALHAEPMNWGRTRQLEVDFGRADPGSDSLFFMASEDPLPEVDLTASAFSRRAWQLQHRSLRDVQEDLNRFVERYRSLFSEHGDLKIKFSNMLAWGQWHYEQHMGEAPSGSDLDRVQKAKNEREDHLREQVKSLSKENEALRERLARLEHCLDGVEADGARQFEQNARIPGEKE